MPINKIRFFTTKCEGCKRKYTPHRILLGFDDYELEKIYIKCNICDIVTEISDKINERQIKDMEKNANK